MIKTYGTKTLSDKIKSNFYRKEIELKTKYNSYGRSIKITTGLIAGFIIDNLVIGTLGIPMLLLKKYGKVLKILRFEKQFNKYLEFFIKPLITQNHKIKF